MKVEPDKKLEEYLERMDEETLMLRNTIRIEGDIYKLVLFFQHGGFIYATEKKSSKKQEEICCMEVENFPLI